VRNWNNTDGIVVNCYNAAGVAVDSDFLVSYTGPLRVLEG
jgi:hypothetical protein